MPPKIPAEDLPPEVLERLGIELPEEETGRRPSKLSSLGKVLQAIGRLDNEEAAWVLTEAMSYIRKKGGHASDTTTVIRATARFFKITPAEITGRQQTGGIVHARHVVMYLLWLSNRYTLAQIGEALSHRSPATVSHGFQQVAHQINTDQAVADQVHRITAELKALGGDW